MRYTFKKFSFVLRITPYIGEKTAPSTVIYSNEVKYENARKEAQNHFEATNRLSNLGYSCKVERI